jgi:hypothetical protein
MAFARKIADTQADRAFLLGSVWWRSRAAHKRAVCAMSLRSSYSGSVRDSRVGGGVESQQGCVYNFG